MWWHSETSPRRLKPRGGRPCLTLGSYPRAIEQPNLGRWRT